jgi:hypothetical protein
MAKQMMDIGIDGNGDLQAVNGDWEVVESTRIHQKGLLANPPGSYPWAPLVGVGAVNYEDSSRPEDFVRKIIEQFATDGMAGIVVKDLPGGVTGVDGYYK